MNKDKIDKYAGPPNEDNPAIEILSKIFSVKIKSKAVLVIPKTDNSGKLFNWKLINWVVNIFLELAEGYNVGTKTGGWKNFIGYIQHEDCYEFTIGIDEEKLEDFCYFLKKVKRVFRQEALYVEYKQKIFILTDKEE
jgi:hypothetical protein